MENKTCCVTGHREIPTDKEGEIRQKLHSEVLQAINDGYNVFISGFADGADLVFADIVVQLKKQFPKLFLEAAIPYQSRLNAKSKQFQQLLMECNGVEVVCEKYQPNCFLLRNRYMINQSSRVIAVYDGRDKGGTLATMRYAYCLERDVRVITIKK